MSKLDDLLVEKADLEDELAEINDNGGPDSERARILADLGDVKDEIKRLERDGDFDDEDFDEG